MKRTVVLVVTAATALLAGCAAGSANNGGSTQVPPAGSQNSKSYTYAGTQSGDGYSNKLGEVDPGALRTAYGGVWSSILDDTANYFSYVNIGEATISGYSNIDPVVGNTSGSGFISLTPAAAGSVAGSGGYAVEIPGEGELLRPVIPSRSGSSIFAPVVAASSSTCPDLKGTVTYQFIAMGSQYAQDLIEHTVYGSIQISGTGTAFTFSNLNMYGFSGDSLQGDALPVGNCGTTQEGYVISNNVTEENYTSGSVSENGPGTATYTVTTSLSPSGLFVMDQGQYAGIFPGPTGLLGLVGVQKPTSQIDTGSLVAGKYLGFQYDALNVGLGRDASIPVSFGQVAGSGTVMTGGGYANDDVSQTPATNITVDLGQQDSANNGLYKSVKVTVPDTFGGCLEQPFGGKDSKGNPTCTYQGVAVAGSVAGKFVLFISTNDLSQAIEHYSAYATLQFFMYQQ